MQLIPSEIPSGFNIRVTDVDPDYIRYRVSVSDGQFAGSAEIFGGPELPATIADAMRGFPSSPADTREIVLGSSDPRAAGGWVKIGCNCTDRAGHSMLDFELHDKEERPRSVSVFLKVVASEIDDTVDALDHWRPELGSSISLPPRPNTR